MTGSPDDLRGTPPLSVRLVLAAAVGLFAYGAYVVLAYPENHDVAWLLHAARALLHGADLYVDVIEPNPPLIVWLLEPVVALASVLHVPAMPVFRVAVLGLTAGVLGWCGVLLRRALPAGERRVGALLAVAAVATLVPLTDFSFGQRDALVAVFLLPYLAAAVATSRGDRLHPAHAFAVGAAAAVGIALKPFAGAVWVGVEAWLALRRGRGVLRRRENLAIVTGGAAYLVLVALFEPDFFGFAAAAMEAYRAYYPASPGILARQPMTLFAAGALALSVAAPASPGLREARRVLAVATLGFLLGVFLQNKGWAYHWVPVQLTAGLLLVVVGADLARLATPTSRRFAAPAAAVLLAAATAVMATERLHRARAVMPAFNQPVIVDVLETYGGDDPVMALSVRVPPAFAFILSEESPVRWGSRFNVLWPVPALYAPGPAGAPADELEWFLVSALTQDFRTSRPALLIVDEVPPPGVPGFRPLEWLQARSPDFRRAFRDYRPLVRVGDYVVYKRLDVRAEG